MKSIVSQNVGGDGATAALGLDSNDAGVECLAIEIKYPLNKLTGPVHAIIDAAIDKMEVAIPGDWDKAVLEPIRVAAHGEIDSLLAGALKP